MRSRILQTSAILLSLITLIFSHWFIGQPKKAIVIEAAILDDRQYIPVAKARFDILTRSTSALIDSLSGIEVVRPSEPIVRTVEDPGREAFLRSLIERQGFILSSQAQQALRDIKRARQPYMDQLRKQPGADLLIDAVQRDNGALADLTPRLTDDSLMPVQLRREAVRLDPLKITAYNEYSEGPDAQTYEMYYEWIRTVDAYDQRYHRDLLERSIFTAALYRAAAIVSVETDSLGHATFSPIHHGQYWLNGHYPADISMLNRLHRLQPDQHTPSSSSASNRILLWDLPVEVTTTLPLIELSERNTTLVTPIP